MRASALAREVEMLQSTVQSQKGQLHQLQEILANREQEHRWESNLTIFVAAKQNFNIEISTHVGYNLITNFQPLFMVSSLWS